MSLWDYIIIAAVLALAYLALRYTLRRRGRRGCDGHCGSCTMQECGFRERSDRDGSPEGAAERDITEEKRGENDAHSA